MQEVSKKTIHFFDSDNKISSKINALYKTQYKILRKEQFYSLLVIEGLKALEDSDIKKMSLIELSKILDFG